MDNKRLLDELEKRKKEIETEIEQLKDELRKVKDQIAKNTPPIPPDAYGFQETKLEI